MSKQRAIQLAILTFCLTGYIWIGYFTTRTDFIQVVSIYSLLFGFYLLILYGRSFKSNVKIVIGGALLLRLALLFMTPNLTDDYFRFIWDGLFLANGHNPYLIIPSTFMDSSQTVPGISQALYEQLNSPQYYSAYPPVCQFIFGLSAKLCGGNILGNIILLGVFILLAEFGTITLLYKLTRIFRLPAALVLIYAFNPLVIIELTGNLHFESIMLFFLLLAVYFLIRERQFVSAISFALAIGTKLFPLIFLPLLIKRMGIGKSLRYFIIVGTTVSLLFAPFFSLQSISNYLSILARYFQVFNFNASVYSLIKWIGYQMAGYNIITTLRLLLPIISFLIIMAIAFREKVVNWQSLFTSMLFCLTAYFLLSTNIHPWNLAPLVLLSVFTSYKYALPWSLLVILTYVTYQSLPYSENLLFVAIEYLTVVGWMVYEIRANLMKVHRI